MKITIFTCALGAMTLAALAIVPQAHAQQATGVRTLEQAAEAGTMEPSPLISHYDYLPRPCPPSVGSCPPAGYPCGVLPVDATTGGAGNSLKSWLFRRYAGSYEMRTKLPYPPGYYGDYYYRPWAPGYVRQEPHDFQPGVYEKPFYHHVDFYPRQAAPHARFGVPVELHDESIPSQRESGLE